MNQALALTLFALGTSVAQAAPSPLIFAVATADGETMVFINTRDHWEAEGSLTDGYSPEEAKLVKTFTRAAHLCNSMESTYTLCSGEAVEPADLVRQLNALNVSFIRHDSDFQAFMELENAPGIEFSGRTYEGYTAVHKLVARLYGEFSTPVDLLGQAEFGDAEREKMREILFPASSYYNDAARAVIRTMAEAKLFSHQRGETRLFQGTIPHLDDREIQTHIEEAIIEVINEGANPSSEDSDLL